MAGTPLVLKMLVVVLEIRSVFIELYRDGGGEFMLKLIYIM